MTSVVTSGVGQTYDDPADVHRQVTSRGRIQSRSLYCTEEVIPYDSSALKSCTGPPNTYSVQPNLISPLKGVHGAHGATLRFADVHPNLKEQMANNNKVRASALPVRRPPGADPSSCPKHVIEHTGNKKSPGGTTQHLGEQVSKVLSGWDVGY